MNKIVKVILIVAGFALFVYWAFAALAAAFVLYLMHKILG